MIPLCLPSQKVKEKSEYSGEDFGIKQYVTGLVRLTADYLSKFNDGNLQPKFRPQPHLVT